MKNTTRLDVLTEKIALGQYDKCVCTHSFNWCKRTEKKKEWNNKKTNKSHKVGGIRTRIFGHSLQKSSISCTFIRICDVYNKNKQCVDMNKNKFFLMTQKSGRFFTFSSKAMRTSEINMKEKSAGRQHTFQPAISSSSRSMIYENDKRITNKSISTPLHKFYLFWQVKYAEAP